MRAGHSRSPTPALLLGLVITLATVVTYSWYISGQISGLRRLQTDLTDRNRRDSLQLLRIQNDLNQLALAMVTDKTGLTGLYDWEIKFDPQVLMQIASQVGVTLPPGVNLPPSDSPSLLTALREDLGLKLDSQRGPVEVLVIDSAEMPEAN